MVKELFTDLMPEKYAFRAMEEINILGQLHSPHIVSYVDSFVSGTKLAIVMEYCENGDLEKYLTEKTSKFTPLPESIIWRYFLQICIGLHHMHS